MITIVIAATANCGSPPSVEANRDVAAVKVLRQQPQQGLLNTPSCTDRDNRHEFHDPGVMAGRFTHELIRARISEIRGRARLAAFPTYVPEWVSCADAELIWETPEPEGAAPPLSYNARVFAYDTTRAEDASRQLMFQVGSPLPYRIPATEGDWVPIEGREGWYESDSKLPDGSPTPGTRIAWSDDEQRYFELAGPFDLEEALRIADSVQI